MSLRTFGQRAFGARTFNARTWTGGGEVVAGVPLSGWVATELNRVVFAQPGRVVHANQLNRVVVALPERIR
jgi:hypothetical protein